MILFDAKRKKKLTYSLEQSIHKETSENKKAEQTMAFSEARNKVLITTYFRFQKPS